MEGTLEEEPPPIPLRPLRGRRRRRPRRRRSTLSSISHPGFDGDLVAGEGMREGRATDDGVVDIMNCRGLVDEELGRLEMGLERQKARLARRSRRWVDV